MARENFYNGRLVVVTGATGLVGSYIVKALSDRGAKVRAIIHTRKPNAFTELASEMLRKDISIMDQVRAAVRGADVVIHAAGVTGGVPLAVNDPGAMVAPNAVLNAQVIHACAKEKVPRLGFTSSVVVYPEADHPLQEWEAWSGDPYPLYAGLAWVKRFSEKLCEHYSKSYGIDISIIRPTGVYGRFDNFEEGSSHVLPAFINRALRSKDRFVVWGDGGDVRDFVHSSDVANAMLLAVEKYAVCDPLNIASGKPVSTKELAELILELTGSKAVLTFDTSKPTAVKGRLIDTVKAKETLGFSAAVTLRDGLMDTVEWYKKTTEMNQR